MHALAAPPMDSDAGIGGAATAGSVAAAAPKASFAASEAPPLEGACVLTEVEPKGTYVLAVRAEGVPFAAVRAHELKASLVRRGDTYAEVVSGAVHLSGYIARAQPFLFASRRTTLGGLVTPRASTAVGARFDAGRLVATYDAEALKLQAAGEVACADLAIEPSTYSVEAEPASAALGVLLPVGEKAPLAATPGGPVVAEVAWFDAVAKSGAQIKVTADLGNAVLVGFTPADRVRRVTAQERARALDPCARQNCGLAGLNGGGGIRLPIPGLRGGGLDDTPVEHASEQLTCPAAVRLVANVDGERLVVGTLDAGSRVRVLERLPSTARISLPSRERGGVSFSRAPVGLEAPLEDLASCASSSVTVDTAARPMRPSEAPPARPTLAFDPAVRVADFRTDVAESGFADAGRSGTLERAERCYRGELAQDFIRGSWSGRVFFQPNGEVEKAETTARAGVSTRLEQCLIRAVRALLPAPASGRRSATIDITFDAKLRPAP